MLTITKIIEGGIDLSTQKELPRSIIVSNGKREITIPVRNGEMEKVVQLYIEGLGMEQADRPHQVVHQVEDSVAPPKESVGVQMAPQQPVEPAGMKFEVPEDNITSDYEEPPPSAADAGFEPGEDYDDVGTGASSL